MNKQLDPNRTALTFPKKEKLKSKKTIESLFVEGKNLREYPIKLIYLKTTNEDEVPIKVGVVAPKKKFKKAVDRNRIKRLLREAYRLNKALIFNNIEGTYAFLFLYLGNKEPNFTEVDLAMKKVLAAFKENECHEEID
ncbi:MAG: ribonuclease P protein component [Allomuricauda sp.]